MRTWSPASGKPSAISARLATSHRAPGSPPLSRRRSNTCGCFAVERGTPQIERVLPGSRFERRDEHLAQAGGGSPWRGTRASCRRLLFAVSERSQWTTPTARPWSRPSRRPRAIPLPRTRSAAWRLADDCFRGGAVGPIGVRPRALSAVEFTRRGVTDGVRRSRRGGGPRARERARWRPSVVMRPPCSQSRG